MIFWLIFLGTMVVLYSIKLYVFRGVRQGLRSRKWHRVYIVFSTATFLIGVTTIICAFFNGMVGMKLYQNLLIGLFFSVIVCEYILVMFFLLDDSILLLNWVKRKVKGHPKPSHDGRRRFVKTTGLALTALPFGAFIYGITKGKYDFRILHQDLYFADLPEAFDGFKIVQFSDIHSGSFDTFSEVERGVQMIADEKADLILFTGDLVNDLESEIIPYKELFGSLVAPHGKYSVLGNHDYSEDFNLFPDEESKRKNFLAIQSHHHDMGYTLMNNTNELITINGESIRLLGVENWGSGFIQEGDLDKALIGTKEDEFTILMSHDPTHWEQKVLEHERHIHLTLAGHTHGMQMGVEVGDFQWSPIQYVYKRWAGLYEELNQYLYVNRGFGFIGFAGRVGIAPEITTFTLHKA